MRYSLEKMSVMKGKNSSVPAGKYIEGDTLTIKNTDIITFPVLECIKEGDMLLVSGGFDFLKTSPIKDIIEASEKTLLFSTETSVYKLEILDEQ